jgi:hypothetical protein
VQHELRVAGTATVRKKLQNEGDVLAHFNISEHTSFRPQAATAVRAVTRSTSPAIAPYRPSPGRRSALSATPGQTPSELSFGSQEENGLQQFDINPYGSFLVKDESDTTTAVEAEEETTTHRQRMKSKRNTRARDRRARQRKWAKNSAQDVGATKLGSRGLGRSGRSSGFRRGRQDDNHLSLMDSSVSDDRRRRQFSPISASMDSTVVGRPSDAASSLAPDESVSVSFSLNSLERSAKYPLRPRLPVQERVDGRGRRYPTPLAGSVTSPRHVGSYGRVRRHSAGRERADGYRSSSPGGPTSEARRRAAQHRAGKALEHSSPPKRFSSSASGTSFHRVECSDRHGSVSSSENRYFSGERPVGPAQENFDVGSEIRQELHSLQGVEAATGFIRARGRGRGRGWGRGRGRGRARRHGRSVGHARRSGSDRPPSSTVHDLHTAVAEPPSVS